MPEPPLPVIAPGPDNSPVDKDVGKIVLQVASTHVGVSLTGVGLVRLLGQQGAISTAADDLLAINALGFLVTSVAAYLALRAGSEARRRKLERVADVLFLLCLMLMVMVGILLAYEIM